MEHLKRHMEEDAIDALNRPNPSIKDVRDVLKLVIEKMWSEERLAEYIMQVHNSLCAKCTKCVPADGKVSGKLIALIGSLVAAVCGLTGAVVKLALSGGAS